MKRLILLAVFSLLLVAPLTSLAADYVPLAVIPGLTDGDVTGTKDLSSFFNKLYDFCIGAAVVLAIIQIIRGGIVYMTTDVVPSKTGARTLIFQAVMGLVLVLSPYLILGTINPQIFSFKLGSGGLDYQPYTPTAEGNLANGATTATTANGVLTSTVGKWFVTATFEGPDSAKNIAAEKAWFDACTASYSIGAHLIVGSTCLNGTATTCTNASKTKATCSKWSPQKFSFVDGGTMYTPPSYGGIPTTPTPIHRLVPLESTKVSKEGFTGFTDFVTQCKTEGGIPFIPQNKEGLGVPWTKLENCSEEAKNTQLVAGALRYCYEAYMLCKSPVKTNDRNQEGLWLMGEEDK